ncbi:MAG TPA: hypothetical protein VFD58_14065 [Blastocatellia bacterium]|nr:hypothetical protein [Blastocatellia bacterium]
MIRRFKGIPLVWKIFFVIVLLLITPFLILGALFPDYSPEYGLVSLKILDGREIYFKRVVWGILGNSDVIVISPDRKLCNLPNNEKTDYVFRSSDSGSGKIYYKFENDTLVLFVWDSASLPRSGEFPVKIIQHELNPMEFYEMEKNAVANGLKVIEVPVDKRLKCHELLEWLTDKWQRVGQR